MTGLFEPNVTELVEVQKRFGLHALAVEEAQSFHLRPKFDGDTAPTAHAGVRRTLS